MNLENYLSELVQKGFLKKENIGIDQIRALLENAEKNLITSKKILEIDEEASYSMAYSSMLKTARALLFLQGFRPIDGQQHKTTVDTAGEILGANFKELINKFDQMRKKRNQFTYDPLIPLSKTETANAFSTANDFHEKVKLFLEKNSRQKNLFAKNGSI